VDRAEEGRRPRLPRPGGPQSPYGEHLRHRPARLAWPRREPHERHDRLAEGRLAQAALSLDGRHPGRDPAALRARPTSRADGFHSWASSTGPRDWAGLPTACCGASLPDGALSATRAAQFWPLRSSSCLLILHRTSICPTHYLPLPAFSSAASSPRIGRLPSLRNSPSNSWTPSSPSLQPLRLDRGRVGYDPTRGPPAAPGPRARRRAARRPALDDVATRSSRATPAASSWAPRCIRGLHRGVGVRNGHPVPCPRGDVGTHDGARLFTRPRRRDDRLGRLERLPRRGRDLAFRQRDDFSEVASRRHRGRGVRPGR